jgi:hypothetical protein
MSAQAVEVSNSAWAMASARAAEPRRLVGASWVSGFPCRARWARLIEEPATRFFAQLADEPRASVASELNDLAVREPGGSSVSPDDDIHDPRLFEGAPKGVLCRDALLDPCTIDVFAADPLTEGLGHEDAGLAVGRRGAGGEERGPSPSAPLDFLLPGFLGRRGDWSRFGGS